MSNPNRGDAAQSGMTMIELLILTAIISMATYSFSRFIISTRQAVSRQDAAGELVQRSLRTITNLRGGLQAAVELIANYDDTTGDGMVPLHNLVVASVQADENSSPGPGIAPGVPAPVSFSGWPTVETLSQVDMNGPTDTSATAWGDEIMYVAELNPITFTAYYNLAGGVWSPAGVSTSTATTAEIISVERLQLVYDYLSWDTRTAVAGSGKGLRLVEWRSQPMIEYSSISGLLDSPSTYNGNTCCPRLQATLRYLTTTGYTMAFNPSNVTLTSNCGGCFYPLTPEADVSSGVNMLPPSSIGTYSWAYMDDYDLVQSFDSKPNVNIGRVSRAGGNAGGQTGSPSGYSVSLNVTGASSPTSVVALQGPGSALLVPAYAVLNYSMPSDAGGFGGAGFPAGFEVSIDGQYDSREIFIRLVELASNAGTVQPGTFQALQETSEISVAPQFDF